MSCDSSQSWVLSPGETNSSLQLRLHPTAQHCAGRMLNDQDPLLGLITETSSFYFPLYRSEFERVIPFPPAGWKAAIMILRKEVDFLPV